MHSFAQTREVFEPRHETWSIASQHCTEITTHANVVVGIFFIVCESDRSQAELASISFCLPHFPFRHLGFYAFVSATIHHLFLSSTTLDLFIPPLRFFILHPCVLPFSILCILSSASRVFMLYNPSTTLVREPHVRDLLFKHRSRLSFFSCSIAVFSLCFPSSNCVHMATTLHPKYLLALWRLAVQFAACHKCVEQCTMDILVCVKTRLKPYIVFVFWTLKVSGLLRSDYRQCSCNMNRLHCQDCGWTWMVHWTNVKCACIRKNVNSGM